MTKTHKLPAGSENQFGYILWQELFNFYRAKGGSLGNMHNILIDYENCQRLFSEPEPESEFIFAFDTGDTTMASSRTTWKEKNVFWPNARALSYVEMGGMPWFDFILHVAIDYEGKTFTIEELVHPETARQNA